MPTEESWGEAVIRVINTADKPLTRKEIAAVFGVKRLTPKEEAMLDMMALAGYIKQEKVPNKGPIPYKHVYSAIKTPAKK